MLERNVQRNSAWLFPFIAGLILATAPLMLEMITDKNPLPAWAPVAAACIGFCASGIGAAFTNTLSAKIIKLLVGVFAVVMVIMIVIKLVNLFH
uniref:Membrane transporter protein n=1 Tax=Klebsiella pneumoniae TaxID=573 RepID=A0A6M3HF10_KLEPN|nr:hypothetical protein [Klebsiella pneumoniae]QIS32214.1 hypothetical protein [Klebsiella pneumoniae]